ncbi:MAG TPA: N-6 DNA methylase [Candidatus Cryosericum sp.]
MLDTDTKRRIDTARDILVGKVPDPKSQVEQITIALIYKFMDDMDAESEELGGKRKFFANQFARYGWANLMHAGLGGFEILNLYAEAIAKMPENPGIPPLFRDIFKNAYLPYRDPETLKMFLKVIDEFNYDHSERLGDAFEYLLSVLGSQGDAGQFRTPRHIIDFMVEVIDPKKTETVLDPACGTAGFLISSYKHILKANTDAKGHSMLTPDEKGRLAQNFRGYDISPDMVRLSLVNMYLHGFVDPHIYEYDTLASQDKWNEYADVILANPPFMSPKGGIKPHNRFSIQAKRSEVLFVDYMAEHLNPTGRAGIIVPEGIIFQSQGAYKQLRKLLVESYLVAVISLPTGVFNPYSGVKTSILILDKTLAKKTGTIAFFKVENDGFGLGAQRRAIDKNDLPQVRADIAEYLRLLRAGESVADFQPALGLIVSKEKIAANGDYNLSGERYREGAARNHTFPLVTIGDVCSTSSGGTPLSGNAAYYEGGKIPWLRSGEVAQGEVFHSELFITEEGLKNSSAKIFPTNTVLVAMYGATAGEVGILRFEAATNQAVCGITPDERLRPDFLYLILKCNKSALIRLAGGGAQPNISQKIIREFQIPLPPLEVQKEIVAEIEGYQKVIDGAKQVIANWKPVVPIDPSWPLVWLRDLENSRILELRRGQVISKTALENDPGDYPVYSAAQQNNGEFGRYGKYMFDEELVSWSIDGGGKFFYRPKHKYSVTNVCGYIRVLKPQTLNCHFLYCVLAMSHARLNFDYTYKAHPSVIRDKYQVPLPPLDTQQRIVSEIENQERMVESCKALVSTYEAKIKVTVARLWSSSPETM